jgi:hypothetical protein
MATKYVEQNRTELIRRIKACRFPGQVAVNMVNRLQIWEAHHGIKWVVQRLKTYSQLLLGSDDPSVRLHEDRTCYGDFRPLFRKAYQSRKGLIRSLRVCKLYGLFVAPSPGVKEYSQFKELVGQRTGHKLSRNYLITPEDMWLAAQAQKKAGFSITYPMGETRAPD